MKRIKELLKSNGFKSVAVLLVICLISVGLLAVLNDLLYVSPEVKFDRAMKKIYDKEGVTFEKTSVDSAHSSNSSFGNVISVVYAKKNGSPVAAVIEARGIASSFGDITCYVVINPEGIIEAWTAMPNTSLFTTASANTINKAYIGMDISNEIAWNASTMKVASLTVSSNGILNAINMAGDYARNALKYGNNPAEDTKQKIIALLAETEVADVTWTSRSTSGYSHLKDATNVLSFVFEATVGDDTYYAFAYTIDGAEQLEYIVINASYNNAVRSTVIAKTDGITEQIVDLVTTNYFNKVARITSVQLSGSTAAYTVLAYAYDHAPSITVNITVANGVVSAISTTGEVATDGFDTSLMNIQLFVGKSLSDIGSLNLVTGATNSNTVIFNAVKTALTHYAANV